MTRRPARSAGALAAGLVLGAVVVIAAPSPAMASTPWPGHPHRHLVGHTVHRGDTATGLAVRFHAWTAELIALNRLGRGAVLRVGERIRIPVVDRGHRRHHHARHHARHRHAHRTRHHHAHHARHPWRHSRMSRDQVRRVIVAKARHHRVPRNLALAIAWQESGWQQHLVSSAHAAGVMQLLPSTGRWMSLRAHRRLNIYGTRDNVLGGVLLLHYLLGHTRHDRAAIGAYYEGLGAVRQSGLYPSTKRYVRSVTAIRAHLRRTGHPPL